MAGSEPTFNFRVPKLYNIAVVDITSGRADIVKIGSPVGFILSANTVRVLEDVGQSFAITNQDFTFVPSDYQFDIAKVEFSVPGDIEPYAVVLLPDAVF